MKHHSEEPFSLPAGVTLYHFNKTPVVAQPDFWPIPVLVTVFLAWAAGRRRPERSWLQRLGVGLLAMPVALLADVGHAMAHTVSARLSGAPMDEILLSSGMPRTLYQNNDVPPQTHISRSLGGPIFSLTSSLFSLLWWRSTPQGSLSHDLAEASLVGHSFIFVASLAPLPMVDGGTMLKWKLVASGRTPEQADRTVRESGVRLGSALLGLGLLMGLVPKRRLLGGLLAAGGAGGIAAAVGWLE